jgi:hypothetical protein
MLEFDKILMEDAKSKLTALNALEALIDRNDVNTIEDIKGIISTYKEVIQVQIKEREGE